MKLTLFLESRSEYYADLYHVTFTKNIPSILLKNGITPLHTSLWVNAAGKRLGAGEIFAFEDISDAIRWASRMEWDTSKTTGTGKVSIIKFKQDGEWDVDKNDPLSQAGSKGRWLKRFKPIPVSEIVGYTKVTGDMIKALVQDKPIPIHFIEVHK
jgi:hypothetical protein